MDRKHTSKETVEREVGRWNTDIALGWEAGLRGKQRIAGRLFERLAPVHFYETQNSNRLLDFQCGKEAAQRYRKQELAREMHFVGHNKAGEEVLIKRKGWNTPRGPIITRLMDKGCFGNVQVYYFDGVKIVRTVNCGI